MATETVTLDQLRQYFLRLNGDLPRLSFQEPLKRCDALAVADLKKNFAEGHGPDGRPWMPIRGFRVRGGGGGADKPLRDRGLLMASATSDGAKGSIHEITDTTLTRGTNLPYARTHQSGAVIVPRSARALSIPMTRDAYRAGNARNFPRKLVLVWPTGKKTGWLIEPKPGRGKEQRGAKTVIHYLLVPKVTIQARPFMGFSPAVLEKFDLVIGDWIAKRIGDTPIG